MSFVLFVPYVPFCGPALRGWRKALQRIPVKRVGLPGGLVPHAVLVADDRNRNDHAVAAELVRRGNTVVKLPTRLNSELH